MKMHLREDILNELREISPMLADMPFYNVYTADPGYFSGIEAELFARIGADKFTGQKSFTVPGGYFDGLAGSIMQKIKAAENDSAAEEIKTLSPVLSGIGNENIYSVPQGYFESLQFTNAEKKPAKVIRMNPARSVFRYAAAAVITGLIGLSVINIADKPGTGKKEIAFFDQAQVNTANNILKTGTFDQELNDLSDNEIDEYLQQSGQDVKAALVVSSVNDESKLPEADDYLLDENTLDNYLKNNNLKN